MSDIPTPFIGGAESPRRGSGEDEALQRPYVPGQEQEEAEAVQADTAAEEPVRVEIEDLEGEEILPETAEYAEEPGLEAPVYELEWPEDTEEPPGEPIASTPEFVELGTEPTVDELAEATPAPDAAPAEELDVPDFLLGADSAGAEVEAEPAAAEQPAASRSAEELAEIVSRLQESILGDSIRALTEDLRSVAPEIAVPRAFAAGYLAAKQEESR